MNQLRAWDQRRRGQRPPHLTRLFRIAVLLSTVLLTIGLSGGLRAFADPESPLAVTLTANPSPVASGAQLTYTITIVNTGGAKVDNLVLTDQVNGVGVIQNPPALPQLQLTSTQGTCTQGGPNGNVVTCNGGSLNGGASWTVTIRGQVVAADGTTINNTASVTGTKAAQNFTTNASVSTLVSGGSGSSKPDLTINKTGATSVATNAPLTYTLTVNNIGTANATGVKVVDTLPAGVTFVSQSATSLFACAAVAQTVTCTGGAVNQGQNATITINAAAPAAPGQITNTAVVDPDNTIDEGEPGSPAELNNTSATVNTNVTSTPSAPLLDIKKTDNPTEYPWSTGAGPDPANPGQQIVYKIQVTNNATGNNSRADDVVVTDGTQGLDAASIIATQVVVDGVIGNGNGCTVTAPEVRCKIRTLNAGGTLTITITGTVISPAGSTIFNTATVTGNIKNTGVSNTDSEETTIRPAVDLTITKADSPDPVCARSWPQSAGGFYGGGANQHLPIPGGAPAATGSVPEILADPVCLGGLLYTFEIGNSGNTDATGVVVRDPLPAGTIFDSYEDTDGAGFVCALGTGNVVTCSGGTIGAGPATTKRLKLLLVAPPTLGTITNTVSVDPNNAIFEADETNNTFTQTTSVTTGIDLVVWKSDSSPVDPPGDDVTGPPTLVPGSSTDLGDGYDAIATRGTQTYTIYVDNVGTQDATGIRVRDTLPAGTTFLSVVADAEHGFTCSHAGGAVECVGGHLLGSASEFYDETGAPVPSGDEFATIKIRVFARETVGTMHNEVRVDPLNEIAEVNELNNTATDDTAVVAGNADKGAYHQLKVTKTHVSPAAGTVATNGTLTYDLHVENLGTDPVSNIVLVDTLPTGTRFIEAKDTDAGTDAFFCSHDGAAAGGVVTCTGGDLDGSINTIPVGGVSRHVRVKVFAPNTPATYTNLATVDPANLVPEGNEFDNDHQVNTVVRSCTSLADCTATNAFYELTIEKAQNRPVIARNGLETYTLTITNLGSDPVFDIVVRDVLPAGAFLLDAKDAEPPSDPDKFTCGAPDASNVITCTGGDLSGTVVAEAGIPTSRQIVMRVFMPDTPALYPNQASVDPDNAVPEGNEFNNQASVTTDVQNGGPNPYVDLQVQKTQQHPDPAVADNTDDHGHTGVVAPGGQVIFTLHVTNNGEADAFNVVVRDVLPENVAYFRANDSATGAGMFTCTYSAPNVDCTGGTIPAGGSRDILVFAQAPASIEGLVSPASLADIEVLVDNRAQVDPSNTTAEGDESNNADEVFTHVRSKLNLTLTKEGPTQATQNQSTEYKIRVKNNSIWGGGQLAENVKVVDGLPTGLIPIGSVVAGGNFVCEVEENPVNFVTCVGSLAAGDEVEITVPVFVTADGGTLDNEACVDPDKTIAETNELDNCAHALTAVGPSVTPANLSIDKTASTGTATAGQEFTYTVAVSNVGGTAATGTITMTDDLPPVLELMGVNPASGWTCPLPAPATPNHVECTRTGLAAGSTENIVISVKVKTGADAPTQAFTNHAEVSGNSETESDEVIVGVGGVAIDLVLAAGSVEDSPDPAAPGGIVTYTGIVTNGGTQNATDVRIRTSMPLGLNFVTATGTNGFSCSFTFPDVDCIGDLAAGGSTTISVVTQVTAVPVPPDTDTAVFVTMAVDPLEVIAESDESNNTDVEFTTVHQSCTACTDLVAGTVLDSPDPVAHGGLVTLVVPVGNAGDTNSGAFTLTITADAEDIDAFVAGNFDETDPDDYSATADFTCDAFGNVVTCTGDLDGGEGTLITLKVRIKATPGSGSLGVVVAVDSGNAVTETTEANNSGSSGTTITP